MLCVYQYKNNTTSQTLHAADLNARLTLTQSIVENLKAENDHLKTGSQFQPNACGPTSSTSQPSGLSSLLGPSVRQPMGMSLTKSFSLSLNDCKEPGKQTLFVKLLTKLLTRQRVYVMYLISFLCLILADVLQADTLSVSSLPDEVCARVLVRMADHTEVSALKTSNCPDS